MSLGSKELFHSNFWAWLIGKEPKFAEVFFDKNDFPEFKTKDFESVKREEGNRDISIHVKDCKDEKNDRCYVIENKFKSMPTAKQLKKYQMKLGESFAGGILTGLEKPSCLTPQGWLIISFKIIENRKVPECWKFLSYTEIAKRIKAIASKSSNEIIKSKIDLIKEYCEVVEKMKTLYDEWLRESGENNFCFGCPNDKQFDEELKDLGLLEFFQKLKMEKFADWFDRNYVCKGKFAIPCFRDVHFDLKCSPDFSRTTPTPLFDVFLNCGDDKENEKLSEAKGFSLGVEIQQEQFRRFVKDEGMGLRSIFEKYSKATWFDESFDTKNQKTIFGIPTSMTNKNKYNKYGEHFVYQYCNLPNCKVDGKELGNSPSYKQVADLIVETMQKATKVIQATGTK